MTEIAKDYAAALFMLGTERGCRDKFLDDLAFVRPLLEQNPEFVELLSSPGIAKAERCNVVEQTFGKSVDEDMVSFIQLLCQRGHIRRFSECVREYENLYKAAKQTSTAFVVSAAGLSETQKANLKEKLEKLTGRSIVLECSVDAALVGGMTVTVDGKIMDGSLRHRLGEVKEVIGK